MMSKYLHCFDPLQTDCTFQGALQEECALPDFNVNLMQQYEVGKPKHMTKKQHELVASRHTFNTINNNNLKKKPFRFSVAFTGEKQNNTGF